MAAFAAFFVCIGAYAVPRPEYPRPQFERKAWVNLNGEWTYSFDFGNSGIERGFQKSAGFDGKIIVPFAPESKLSGVEYKDFINHIWYQRNISVPAGWEGKRVFIVYLRRGIGDTFVKQRNMGFATWNKRRNKDYSGNAKR